jgi:hypothetical protein
VVVQVAVLVELVQAQVVHPHQVKALLVVLVQ